MAILIGHASIDEHNKASGGTAGDQTGKEVCTRTWYSKPWDFVLRCKNSTMAEKMASACEKGCANQLIGYDQSQRNTLYTQAKAVNYDLSRIQTACECDCSSFMTVCALAAGVKLTYGSNAPTTATMKNVFVATGEFELLTDKNYLSSDNYLKRGDILVKAGSHTVMALQNGAKAITASAGTASVSTALKIDGLWGPATTKRLQQLFSTTVDSKISNQPMSEKTRNPGLSNMSGWDWKTKAVGGSLLMKAIQKKVGTTQDGFIGKNTITAMQKWLGTTQDGVISNPSLMVKALQKWCNQQ